MWDSPTTTGPPKKLKFKDPSAEEGVTKEGPEVVSTKIRR